MTVSATVVLDSISPAGKRLTTFQIAAHRFILAEINTHRMLSRSYRSSRAVPSKRLIEEVRTNPAMPVHWGANRPGMQAKDELTGDELVRAKEHWRFAARAASDYAENMAAEGLHKQVANRVLEPFMWAHGVITATEWDNFFGLRLHEDAQPEFRALAEVMWAAREASDPKLLQPSEWHLPYIDRDEQEQAFRRSFKGREYDAAWQLDLCLKMSVARCARASIKSFDTDKPSTIEEDLATYVKLNIPGTESYDPSRPIHASPAEHQATPDEFLPDETILSIYGAGRYKRPDQWGNLVGFRQYRKMLPGEAVAPLPEAYK